MRRWMLGAVALGVLVTGRLVGQRPTNALDLSFGVRDGQQRSAAMISRRWPLLGGAFSLGLGVRVTSYRGDAIALTLQAEGAGFAPTEIVLEPEVVSANLAILAGLQLVGPLSVGANLDLVGAATGPTTASPAGDAKPAGVSYFQNGTGDHGSLNSEFHATARLSRSLSIRAGLSHYVLGFEAASLEGDSRYQRFIDVSFVGLRLDF